MVAIVVLIDKPTSHFKPFHKTYKSHRDFILMGMEPNLCPSREIVYYDKIIYHFANNKSYCMTIDQPLPKVGIGHNFLLLAILCVLFAFNPNHIRKSLLISFKQHIVKCAQL